MPNAVIKDWKQFNTFLATQPFCLWSAQKQQEMDMGMHAGRGRSSIHHPPPKNDNDDLLAALSTMA